MSTPRLDKMLEVGRHLVVTTESPFAKTQRQAFPLLSRALCACCAYLVQPPIQEQIKYM